MPISRGGYRRWVHTLYDLEFVPVVHKTFFWGELSSLHFFSRERPFTHSHAGTTTVLRMVRCSHAGCWNGLPCPEHGPGSGVSATALTAEQMLHPDVLSDDTILNLLKENSVSALPRLRAGRRKSFVAAVTFGQHVR